jgi:hypothetical protein
MRSIRSAAAIVMASITAAACLSRTPPETAPAPPASPGATAPARPAEAPVPDPNLKILDQRTKDLELQLLEKDAEIQDFKGRLAAQQRRLDDSIQEVVRAKAKLLSLESRAEAASQMAESEIAMKALESRATGDEDPDLPQIRELLKMSSLEFEKENFGGALYLTIQAKSRIQESELRLRSRDMVAIGRDEVPFPSPLFLKVTKTCNLRDHPDLAATILVTLAAGTPVTGFSHKGEWVRVVGDDGSRGWIHQGLLSPR